MSSCLRKIKRSMKPHYSCCGSPMLYKESHKVYICERCGKEKLAKNIKGGAE